MAGIYLHIPFCKTRCIYCDFYSTTREDLRQRYVQALCLEQAGQREEAISCLEKALSCLKSGKRELEKPSIEAEVLRILYERQCTQAQYRFPMREAEAVCLPAYARERILRLMIDLCAQLNDGARVRTLVASLQGKRFENVEKALRQISEKET